MTIEIEKAIETLEKILRATGQKEGMQEYDAIKLGVEALKRELKSRQVGSSVISTLLPGETNE